MFDVIIGILILFVFFYVLSGIFFTIFSYLWYGAGLSRKLSDIFRMIFLFPIIVFKEEEK